MSTKTLKTIQHIRFIQPLSEAQKECILGEGNPCFIDGKECKPEELLEAIVNNAVLEIHSYEEGRETHLYLPGELQTIEIGENIYKTYNDFIVSKHDQCEFLRFYVGGYEDCNLGLSGAAVGTHLTWYMAGQILVVCSEMTDTVIPEEQAIPCIFYNLIEFSPKEKIELDPYKNFNLKDLL